MLRFLGQGWPRISPFLTSNWGKQHSWKLVGYSATLERYPWCDPTWGFNFLVVQKENQTSIPDGCCPQRIFFTYLSYCSAGKILFVVPMTDKETLAISLVLAWSSLVSSSAMFTKWSPRRYIGWFCAYLTDIIKISRYTFYNCWCLCDFQVVTIHCWKQRED